MYLRPISLQVNYVTSFNSTAFPGSLVIAKEDSLLIGALDSIQKLQIRSIPLGEQPRRISHQEASRTFAVLTEAPPTAISEPCPGSLARMGSHMCAASSSSDILSFQPGHSNQLSSQLLFLQPCGRTPLLRFQLPTPVV